MIFSESCDIQLKNKIIGRELMHLEPRTPLRKRASFYEQASKSIETQRSSQREKSPINQLWNKFSTISKQIVVEHDTSNFNMAQFQKDGTKVQYDQSMLQAKLKRLENRAELNRANMELEQRRKKSTRHPNPALYGRNQDSYLKTYKTFINSPEKKLFEQKSDTDSDQEKNIKEVQYYPGITHFDELKKHPRFLKYTIDRHQSKQLSGVAEQKIKFDTVENIKNDIKTLSLENSKNPQTARARIQAKETNPEEIADNIFRKIYTKRNKEISTQVARTERRVAKMIDKQEQILDTIDDKSLSKQNYKKLKVRLGQIVNQMYHDEKRHQIKLNLPKINMNNSSSRMTQYDQ